MDLIEILEEVKNERRKHSPMAKGKMPGGAPVTEEAGGLPLPAIEATGWMTPVRRWAS